MESLVEVGRMNDDIFDQHADRYSSTIDQSLAAYGASHDFFTRHKTRLIDWLLTREGRSAAQMDLLDVGCGIGNIHELIGPKFRGVAGVDVSAASIEAARLRFPSYEYLFYDGNRLPYDDNSKDLSLAICVFHHVPPSQWANLALEMLRVLRPGGLALVIEHNPWNPVTRRIVNRCPIDKDAVLLNRCKTVQLFKEAGAARVEARSILSVPPKTDFLMRIDNLFGYLPLGAQYWCLAGKEPA